MILRAVQVKCIVEFFHIVQSAFCGIVGNVISPAADGLNVKEKTASGGKREWNCGGIYGMMGIGMSCVACGSYGIRQIAYKIAQGTWEIG